jgi:hypothetical protein
VLRLPMLLLLLPLLPALRPVGLVLSFLFLLVLRIDWVHYS